MGLEPVSCACAGTLLDAPRKASRPPASPEAPPSGFSRRPRGGARASSLVRRDRAAPPVEPPPARGWEKPRPRKFVASPMPAPRGDREGEAARARATPASDEPPGASGITLDREARKIIVRDVIRVVNKLASKHVTDAVREARTTVAAAAHEGALRRLARARDEARAGANVASPYASAVAAARGESRVSREDLARAAAEHIAALADRELEHARAVRIAAEREERGSPEEQEQGSPAPGSGAHQPTLDGVVAALFAAGSAEAERAETEEAAAGGGGAGRAPGAEGAEAAPALGPGARAADLAARGRDGGEAIDAAVTSRDAGDAAAGGAGAPPPGRSAARSNPSGEPVGAASGHPGPRMIPGRRADAPASAPAPAPAPAAVPDPPRRKRGRPKGSTAAKMAALRAAAAEAAARRDASNQPPEVPPPPNREAHAMRHKRARRDGDGAGAGFGGAVVGAGPECSASDAAPLDRSLDVDDSAPETAEGGGDRGARASPPSSSRGVALRAADANADADAGGDATGARREGSAAASEEAAAAPEAAFSSAATLERLAAAVGVPPPRDLGAFRRDFARCPASVTALLVSLARNVEPLVEPLRGILDAAARAHARDAPLTSAPGAAEAFLREKVKVASEEDPTPRATPEARVPEETAEATPDRTRAGTRDPPRALAPRGPANAPSSAPGPAGDRVMKLKLKAFGVQLVRRRPLDAAEAELSPGPSPECGVAVPVARVAPGRPPSKLREADHGGQAR